MTVKELVAEKLANSGEVVRGKVVDILVSDELTKRTTLVANTVKVIEDTQVALGKIKPDQQSYDGNGVTVSETFSKGKLDEKRKLESKLKKFSDALDKAFTDNNFDDLAKLGGGGNNNQEQGKGKPADGDSD